MEARDQAGHLISLVGRVIRTLEAAPLVRGGMVAMVLPMALTLLQTECQEVAEVAAGLRPLHVPMEVVA